MLGFDQAYTNDQLVKIEKLKQQIAQKRLEEEKKKADAEARIKTIEESLASLN